MTNPLARKKPGRKHLPADARQSTIVTIRLSQSLRDKFAALKDKLSPGCASMSDARIVDRAIEYMSELR